MECSACGRDAWSVVWDERHDNNLQFFERESREDILAQDYLETLRTAEALGYSVVGNEGTPQDIGSLELFKYLIDLLNF